MDINSIEHNPAKVVKKKYPATTGNMKELHSIETELSADELQMISVGPNN